MSVSQSISSNNMSQFIFTEDIRTNRKDQPNIWLAITMHGYK